MKHYNYSTILQVTLSLEHLFNMDSTIVSFNEKLDGTIYGLIEMDDGTKFKIYENGKFEKVS